LKPKIKVAKKMIKGVCMTHYSFLYYSVGIITPKTIKVK